jgi:hypothetical protein
MRQVPQNRVQFLIIGNGKLAKHLLHYFSLLEIPFFHWCRQDHTQDELISLSQKADRVLFAISDSAIESFFQDHIEIFQDKLCIHFSGSISVPGIFCIHPLMSFSGDLFSLKDYQKISFNVFDKNYKLAELLPGLENPSYNIDPSLKGKYHAHCASIGNLPQFIWSESSSFWENLEIPTEALEGFILQSFKNAMKQKDLGITGPISRKDDLSISKNIEDLGDTDISKLYSFFNEYYQAKEKHHEKH